jgi:hypothetical protein
MGNPAARKLCSRFCNLGMMAREGEMSYPWYSRYPPGAQTIKHCQYIAAKVASELTHSPFAYQL